MQFHPDTFNLIEHLKLLPVLKATDPGADLVEVYNTETDERVLGIVSEVSVKDGWLIRYRTQEGNPQQLVWDEAIEEFLTECVEGPWAIRAVDRPLGTPASSRAPELAEQPTPENGLPTV